MCLPKVFSECWCHLDDRDLGKVKVFQEVEEDFRIQWSRLYGPEKRKTNWLSFILEQLSPPLYELRLAASPNKPAPLTIYASTGRKTIFNLSGYLHRLTSHSCTPSKPWLQQGNTYARCSVTRQGIHGLRCTQSQFMQVRLLNGARSFSFSLVTRDSRQ